MIHGADVSVEFASTENGYIELPPGADKNKWVQIAAGKELLGKVLSNYRKEMLFVRLIWSV